MRPLKRSGTQVLRDQGLGNQGLGNQGLGCYLDDHSMDHRSIRTAAHCPSRSILTKSLVYFQDCPLPTANCIIQPDRAAQTLDRQR
jgi:hypothetical protein